MTDEQVVETPEAGKEVETSAAGEADQDVVDVDRPLVAKHKLHRAWTMWYDAPVPGAKPDPNASWHDKVKKIVSFRYVEDFWSLFNNLMAPSKLAVQSNYHLFKEGVMPAWEDPVNKSGGKWALQLGTQEREKKLLDEIWMNAILDIIGENFEDMEDICGIVLSLRKSRNRVSLWTKTSKDAAIQKRIGAEFKEKMTLSARHKLSYTAHDAPYTGRGGPKPLYEA